jgi:hypothetical protein
MNRDTYTMMVLGFLLGHWAANSFFIHPDMREKTKALEARVQVLEAAAGKPEKP